MNNFLTQVLPNWIMALAAFWGVFEIIRGYFKLKQQQRENEQKMDYFNEQLNEFRKQTTQFEYQTTIMNENNIIVDRGIENLLKILGRGQEAEEQRLEIERQRRINEIRPFFIFNRGLSNPREFSINLKNNGGTADGLRIIDVSKESISIYPITIDSVIEKGQELRITGSAKGEFNSNTVTGKILLGFTDVDGNQYQQNIIKNYQGYQIGLPKAIET